MRRHTSWTDGSSLTSACRMGAFYSGRVAAVGRHLLPSQRSGPSIARERSGRSMGRALPVLLSMLLIAICSSIAHGAGALVVPAGTVLNVRTTQPIAADSSQPGMTVTGVFDDPVAVNGDIVIPRGAIATLEVVNVEQSSNMKGRDRITLKI